LIAETFKWAKDISNWKVWLKAEGFVERVKQWWNSYHFQSSPIFIMAHKLKALKVDLRRWNEEVFGNIERQKKIFWKSFEVLN
jgi:hypothetical protein